MLRFRSFQQTNLQLLWSELSAQSRLQHSELNKLTLRRPNILHSFQAIGEYSGDDTEAVLGARALAAREVLSRDLENFISDGIKWGGHDIAQNLRPSVNNIVAHCYYTISCLDLFTDLCERQAAEGEGHGGDPDASADTSAGGNYKLVDLHSVVEVAAQHVIYQKEFLLLPLLIIFFSKYLCLIHVCSIMDVIYIYIYVGYLIGKNISCGEVWSMS